MPEIKGFLVFESPVYRGNSKKTIFTRGSSQEEITLPGTIDGPAKSIMNAFTGFWRHPRNPNASNKGLLESLWYRLYQEDMPRFVTDVSCKLEKQEPFFDLKMGIAIDRDRMAQAEDQNYRL